jgi:cyclopropane-fatty-acyl-phospholipid synthase
MSTAVTVTTKRSFYEKVLLDLLSKMSLGSLELTLPSGETLKIGNGIGISASVEIKDNDFFRRCVLYGDIGFGECYVEGIWDTDNITNVIKWFLLNIENAPSVSGSKTNTFILNCLKIFNRIYHNRRANSLEGSKKNIAEHYDLNNDFFSLWLDPSMTYSSAYFADERMSLEDAQVAKYESLCQSLKLKPSDHVLEIGSGWGANAMHMASKYGCKVTTVTISEEQHKLATQRVKAAGLSDKVTVLLQDYRAIQGEFDKIVSIEMLEAVGANYFETFFRKCAGVLKKDGILAFQVITCPDSRFEDLKKGVDWIQKHIFPGSLLPSVAAINRAVNNTSELTMIGLKEFGPDYARTLAEWFRAFNDKKDEVKKLGFSDSFMRKWNYYLCYCEAAFAMRNIYVMQLVYSRPNNQTY